MIIPLLLHVFATMSCSWCVVWRVDGAESADGRATNYLEITMDDAIRVTVRYRFQDLLNAVTEREDERIERRRERKRG